MLQDSIPTRDFIDFSKLRSIIQLAGHDDRSLAKATGLGHTRIYRFLNTKKGRNKNPSATVFLAICRALKIPDAAFQIHTSNEPVQIDEMHKVVHEDHFCHIGGGYCLTSYSSEMDSYWLAPEAADAFRVLNLQRQGFVEPEYVEPRVEVFREMHEWRTEERLDAEYVLQILGSPAKIRAYLQNNPEMTHLFRTRMKYNKKRTVFGMLREEKEALLYRSVCKALGINWFSKVNIRDEMTLAVWQGTLITTWYDSVRAKQMRRLIEEFAGKEENAYVPLPRLDELRKRQRIDGCLAEKANRAACTFFDTIAPLPRVTQKIFVP